MKKSVSFAFALLCMSICAAAQDWPCLSRYGDADMALSSFGKSRVVLMGDSITDGWVEKDTDLFSTYGFLGRGISGQTTPQMLIRFRHDVVETGADAVAILAGTNDIAGNTGPSTLEMIVANIASMCDIARGNGIRPLICSVLPAHRYPWRPEKRPDILIPELNRMLKQYADREKITYVDYFSAMVDIQDPGNVNGLPKEYSRDGVHPNRDGYKIMDEVLLSALRKSEIRTGLKDNSTGLKMMTYKVRKCLGMDGVYNEDRTAAVINSFTPAVVAVQELDSLTRRTHGMYVLERLAKATGMHYTFGKAIDFDGGAYGVGILSYEKPLRSASVPLPGREEPRTLLMAEFEEYIFCCTHLSLVPDDRLASIEIIVDSINGFREGCPDKPVFMAGDFNSFPDSEQMNGFGKYFRVLSDTAAGTFPAVKPECTIDYIAVMKGTSECKVTEGAVLNAPTASDHRPVYCKVKF